jgi:hypothetical protein
MSYLLKVLAELSRAFEAAEGDGDFASGDERPGCSQDLDVDFTYGFYDLQLGGRKLEVDSRIRRVT